MAKCERCGKGTPEQDLTFSGVEGKWICPPCYGYSDEKLMRWGYLSPDKIARLLPRGTRVQISEERFWMDGELATVLTHRRGGVIVELDLDKEVHELDPIMLKLVKK